jgi:hypothetical protein
MILFPGMTGFHRFCPPETNSGDAARPRQKAIFFIQKAAQLM